MNPGFFIQRLRHEQLKRENAGPVVDAHKHSSRHGEELARSDRAGCFYCRAVVARRLVWLAPVFVNPLRNLGRLEHR